MPEGVYFHPMSYGRRGVWSIDEPAPTIRGVQRAMPPDYVPHPRDASADRSDIAELTLEELSILQTYPPFTSTRKTSPMTETNLQAVDLFAGTGWGVACQRLGIDEVGVELMPEARATREANGMVNWLADVWDVLEHAPIDSPEFKRALLIASPPCQTFSMAGGGAGRKALDEVLGLIDSRAYLDPAKLREFGERHDPRTSLVLTPLTYVARHVPTYVVLEQVPPVLPVWERIATEMRGWGYSVWVGILNAEQYGVPQTRKRAILIGRADGVEAAPPTPTHSRYYPRDPGRLDEGVLRWVSMAEALGWNVEPGELTVRTSMGAPKVDDRNGTHEIDPAARPMHTVTSKSDSVRVMRSNYGTGGDPDNRGERSGDEPAATVTSKADRNKWMTSGTRRGAAIRRDDQPSPTLAFGHDAETVKGKDWVEQSAHSQQNGVNQRPTTIPANTVASDVGGLKYIDEGEVTDRARELYADVMPAAAWTHGETGEPIKLDPDKPATTVAADPRLTAREHHNHGEQSATSTKVTVAEASALQSYPAGFDWAPPVTNSRDKVAPLAKTKAFLQIGNAVPPTLAEAVLSTFLD